MASIAPAEAEQLHVDAKPVESSWLDAAAVKDFLTDHSPQMLSAVFAFGASIMTFAARNAYNTSVVSGQPFPRELSIGYSIAGMVLLVASGTLASVQAYSGWRPEYAEETSADDSFQASTDEV